MSIDLTIKTLDSQNRAFTVPDDYSVRQLKEHIAESVNVSADVQRLIHCGRVMDNEKKLSEYNVHGKVIHLVERAPPSMDSQGFSDSRSRAASSTESSRNTRPPRFQVFDFFNQETLRETMRQRGAGTGTDGVYLGAMAFPADLMDSRGVNMGRPHQSLSRSRLVLATNMLNQANMILTNLEIHMNQTPEENLQQPNREPEAHSQESTSLQESISGETPSDDNDDEDVRLATQAATTAAIWSTVSAVMGEQQRESGEQQESSSGPEDTIDITIEGDVSVQEIGRGMDMVMREEVVETSPVPPLNVASSPTTMETEPVEETESDENENEHPEAEDDPRDPDTTPNVPNERPRPNNRVRENVPRADQYPRDMGNVILQLNQITQRMQPFMAQYQALLENDPNYEQLDREEAAGHATVLNYPRRAADASLLFSRISEVMHCLSHGYHALSDITCSFTRQEPPRLLRCRPVLIQHSAVVQAGVPILIPGRGAHSVTIETRPRNQAAGESSTSTSTEATANETPSITSTSADQSSTNTTTQTTSGTATPSTNNNNNYARFQIPTNSNNMNIFMEVGPDSVTLDSVETTVHEINIPPEQRNASTDSDNNTDGPSMAWGPGRAEMLRNIIGSFDPSGNSDSPWTVTMRNESTPSSSGTQPPAISIGPSEVQNLLLEAMNDSMNMTEDINGEPNIRVSIPLSRTNISTPTTVGGASTSTTQVSPTSGGRPTVDATQNSQARGNTQTHPTTATQTRSTSRPFLARTIQNHLHTFDPFLPCNSHHIRNRRGASSAAAATSSVPPTQGTTSTSTTNSGRSTYARPLNTNSANQTPGAGIRVPNNIFSNLMESIFNNSLGFGNLTQQTNGNGNIIGGTANISLEINGVPVATSTTELIRPSSESPASPPMSEQGSQRQGNNFERGFFAALLSNLNNFVTTNQQQANGPANTTNSTSGPGSSNNALTTLPSGMRPAAPAGTTTPPTFVPPVLTRRSPIVVEINRSAIAPEMMTYLTNLDDYQRRVQRDPFLRAPPTPPRDVIESCLDPGRSFETVMPMSLASYFGVNPDRTYSDIIEGFILSATRTLGMRNILEIDPICDTTHSYSPATIYRQLFPNPLPSSRCVAVRFNENVDRVNNELRYYINLLPNLTNSSANPNIDLVRSIEAVNAEYLPYVFICMIETGRSHFVVIFINYIRTLVAVLTRYFRNDMTVIKLIFEKVLSYFASDNSLYRNRISRILGLVPLLVTSVETINITRFLISPSSANAPQSVSSNAVSSSHSEVTLLPVPMEIETNSENGAAASAAASMPLEVPLPDNFVLGSESWHNTLPSEWVPMIARDAEKQKNGESEQQPYSDAYLEGMPKKRRKIVNNSKPSSNITQAITDTMTTAIRSANLATPPPRFIVENAAIDPELRLAFREQIREQVADRIQSSSDLTAERFPNAKKFFNKKK